MRTFTTFHVVYQKLVLRVSSGVPKKQMKARDHKPIYCFEVFGTPDEIRSTSFFDVLSNKTIKKYAV